MSNKGFSRLFHPTFCPPCQKTWLLTAFEKKNSVLDNTTDTAKTTIDGKRNDTATPLNTVSEGKSTKKGGNDKGYYSVVVEKGGRLRYLREDANGKDRISKAEWEQAVGAGARHDSEQTVLDKKAEQELREFGARYSGIPDTVEEIDDLIGKIDPRLSSNLKDWQRIRELVADRGERHKRLRAADRAEAAYMEGLYAEKENNTVREQRADERADERADMKTPQNSRNAANFGDPVNPAPTETASEEQQAIVGGMAQWLNEAGISTSVSEQEGQAVLDAYHRMEQQPGGEDTGLRESKKHSKAHETLRRRIGLLDYALSLTKNEPIQQVRKEREEKEAQFRARRKELYEKVLQGDFNDITLQLLNDYIDNAFPNFYFRRFLSERLPERALQALYGRERENSVDALFSRICESAVPASERKSRSGKAKIQAKKEELLEKWAKATGHWHTDVKDFTNDATPIGSGKDSDVYLSKDGKSVIKFSKGKDTGKFPPDVDAIALFNMVFPGNRYKILGYGRINGRFVKILEQRFVNFKDSEPLTQQERTTYMHKMGFEPINKEQTVFSNGQIVISDVQGTNIVRDEKGNIRVIDADVKLHTRDLGGKYTIPPVEQDIESLGPGRQSLRLMRGYHGSGADFERFDHSHMGEGEGAQAHGWGTYIAAAQGTAKHYATFKSENGIHSYIYNGKTYNFDGIVQALQGDLPFLFRFALMDVIKKLGEGNDAYVSLQIDNYIESAQKEIKRLSRKKAHLASGETKEHALKVNSLIISNFQRIRSELGKIAVSKNVVYVVEIPDKNGRNYIEEDKTYKAGDKEVQAVKDTLYEKLIWDEEGVYASEWSRKELKKEMDADFAGDMTGAELYGNLYTYLGGEEEASMFLNSMGYKGIHYYGQRDGDCYVIFNENDLKITDKVKFFRSPRGEVLGFTVGGRIYIDPTKARPETPLHEYGHIWLEALKQGNRKEYDRLMADVMSNAKLTPIWEEVRSSYSDHTEEEMAEEVFVMYSGRKGAARIQEEVNRVAHDEGMSLRDKATTIAALHRLRKAIANAWKSILDFLHIHYKDADEAADQVLKDFLSQNNPMEALGEDGGNRSDQSNRSDQTGTSGQNMHNRQSRQNGTSIKIGDRAAQREYLLGNNYASKLSGHEFQKSETPLTEKVAKYYQEEYGGQVDRPEIGKVLLNRRGVKDSISHGIGRLKSAAFAAVPDIICKGAIIDHQDNWKGRNQESYTIAAPVEIGDNGYVGVVIVTRGKGTEENRFYLHEVVLQKNLQDESIKTDTKADSHRGDIAKLLKEIVTAPQTGTKSDIRYQFLGEKGAAALDQAEERGARLSNLITARQMEKDGKDAYDIKMATGWERGADKKWRYEVADAQVSTGAFALNDKDLYSRPRRLEDVLRGRGARTLFRAYPQLRDTEVVIHPAANTNGAWGWVDNDGRIAVSDAVLRYGHDLRSVLLHEIQHKIQRIEGFARGGNSKEFETLNSEEFRRAAMTLRDMVGRDRISWQKVEDNSVKHISQLVAQGDMTEATRLLDELNRSRRSRKKMERDNESALQRAASLEQRADEIDDKGLNGQVEYNGHLYPSAYDAYLAIAGEVEARNVEHRMDYSPDEHHTLPAQWTQDIAREDQIFLSGGEDEQFHDFYTNRKGTANSRQMGNPGTQESARQTGSALSGAKVNNFSNKEGKDNDILFRSKSSSANEADRANQAGGNEDTPKSDRFRGPRESRPYEGDGNTGGYETRPYEGNDNTGGQRQKEAASVGTIREAAEAAAEKLGVKITIVHSTDISDADAERQRLKREAKGWFDTQTGQIVLVEDNHTDSADAIATVLHEGVAHYGLRQIVGKENMDAFLKEVWREVDGETCRRISALALEKGFDLNRATEEYMASIAERTDFEKMSSPLRRAWEAIKRAFRHLLDRLGIKDYRLTDGDLRYILWSSFQNLRHGQRATTLVDMAKDAAMRWRTGVGMNRQNGHIMQNGHREEDVEQVNKRFNEDIERYERGELPQGFRFDLGHPSAELRSAGFDNLPISMRASLIGNKAGDERHPFGASDLKDLVKAIQKPIAIFHYSKNNMRNLIVDVSRGGKHFLVGVTLNYKANGIEINSVSGLFPKESHEWIKWIQDDKAIRIDQKNKVLDLIASLRTNPAESERIGLNLDYVAKLVRDFENPKLPAEENGNRADEGFALAGKKADTPSPLQGGALSWGPRDNTASGLIRPYEGEDKDGAKTPQNSREAANFGGPVKSAPTNRADMKSAPTEGNDNKDGGTDDTLLFRRSNSHNVGIAPTEGSNRARDTYNYDTTQNSAFSRREAMQDSMLGLKKLQDAIAEQTGTPVKDYENAYMQENSMSSRNLTQMNKYVRKRFRPLLEAISKLEQEGAEYDDVMEYMLAKHGVERQRELSVREALTDKDGNLDTQRLAQWEQRKQAVLADPANRTWTEQQGALDYVAQHEFGANLVAQDYAGLTGWAAAQLGPNQKKPDMQTAMNMAYQRIPRFEREHPKTADALWEAVNAATKETLKTSYEGGLMTKEAYKNVAEMYQYYVPMRGWADTTSDKVYDYLEHARSRTNSTLKTARGRSSMAEAEVIKIQKLPLLYQLIAIVAVRGVNIVTI